MSQLIFLFLIFEILFVLFIYVSYIFILYIYLFIYLLLVIYFFIFRRPYPHFTDTPLHEHRLYKYTYCDILSEKLWRKFHMLMSSSQSHVKKAIRLIYRNRERCVFTCEKNDTSTQKATEVCFAPKFPPFLGACRCRALVLRVALQTFRRKDPIK